MSNSLQKTMPGARHSMTGRKVRWGEQLLAYILLIPAVSVFAVSGWYPLLRTLASSFFRVRLAGESTFVGFLNYQKMLTNSLFVTAWKNSFEFVLWSPFMGFLLPAVLSILVNEARRLAGVFRLVYYLPVVIPITVAMVIWRAFYYPDSTGLINFLLSRVGLPSQFWLLKWEWTLISWS
jgi:multiple sugar transport system permease protein